MAEFPTRYLLRHILNWLEERSFVIILFAFFALYAYVWHVGMR